MRNLRVAGFFRAGGFSSRRRKRLKNIRESSRMSKAWAHLVAEEALAAATPAAAPADRSFPSGAAHLPYVPQRGD